MEQNNRRTLDIVRKPTLLVPNHPGAVDFIKKRHFSLADWDYRPNNGFQLDEFRKVSPPTSLRDLNSPNWDLFQADWVLLKTALGQCIPEGRILHYFQGEPGNVDFRFLFRVQDVPETEYPQNCYYMRYAITRTRIIRRVNSVDTELVFTTEPPGQNPDTWHHWRLTFFTYITALFTPTFRIILEYEQAG
ncbi:unnamed protein product, partial [marine sediment metagenome]